MLIVGVFGHPHDVEDRWCADGYVPLDVDEMLRGVVLAVDPIVQTRDGQQRTSDVVNARGWDGLPDVEAARVGEAIGALVRYLSAACGPGVWAALLAARIERLAAAGVLRVIVTGLRPGSAADWVAAHGHLET